MTTTYRLIDPSSAAEVEQYARISHQVLYDDKDLEYLISRGQNSNEPTSDFWIAGAFDPENNLLAVSHIRRPNLSAPADKEWLHQDRIVIRPSSYLGIQGFQGETINELFETTNIWEFGGAARNPQANMPRVASALMRATTNYLLALTGHERYNGVFDDLGSTPPITLDATLVRTAMGPYSSEDPIFNSARLWELAERLRKEFFIPVTEVNPIDIYLPHVRAESKRSAYVASEEGFSLVGSSMTGGALSARPFNKRPIEYFSVGDNYQRWDSNADTNYRTPREPSYSGEILRQAV